MSRAAPATSIRKLVDRVSALEQEVADMKERIRANPAKDWRRTVGMFSGDEMMKQIDELARQYREADRRRARRATKSVRRKAHA